MRQKLIIILTLIAVAVPAAAEASEPYDFRESNAYKKLSGRQRYNLEKVNRDFILLWGALDMYAEQHDGEPPDNLDCLVPAYLPVLPSDPFAKRTDDDDTGFARSKAGKDYLYRKGAPGNRAWCIASAGLTDFPFLAEKGNVGLYRCKGIWLSGSNLVLIKEEG